VYYCHQDDKVFFPGTDEYYLNLEALYQHYQLDYLPYINYPVNKRLKY